MDVSVLGVVFMPSGAVILGRIPMCAVPNGIHRIFRTRPPGQIVWGICRRLAVEMSGQKPVWSRPNKCLQHQVMNKLGDFRQSPTGVEVYPKMSGMVRYWSEDLPMSMASAKRPYIPLV